MTIDIPSRRSSKIGLVNPSISLESPERTREQPQPCTQLWRQGEGSQSLGIQVNLIRPLYTGLTANVLFLHIDFLACVRLWGLFGSLVFTKSNCLACPIHSLTKRSRYYTIFQGNTENRLRTWSNLFCRTFTSWRHPLTPPLEFPTHIYAIWWLTMVEWVGWWVLLHYPNLRPVEKSFVSSAIGEPGSVKVSALNLKLVIPFQCNVAYPKLQEPLRES